MCSPLEIEGLAALVFGFLPEKETIEWIDDAFQTKDLVCAQNLILWSQILTMELYKVCKLYQNLEMLFFQKRQAAIQKWIVSNKHLQRKLVLNPKWNCFRNLYSLKINMLFFKKALVAQSTNAIEFALETKGADAISTLCKSILADLGKEVRWTNSMLAFVVGLSEDVVDALRKICHAGKLKIADRSSLDALYQYFVLDPSLKQQQFLQATDFMTIVYMFDPCFPIHSLHSPKLLEAIFEFHMPTEETIVKLLKPLWCRRGLLFVNSIPKKVFRKLNPNSTAFRSLFQSNSRFFKQAIARTEKYAIKWGLKHLKLSKNKARSCMKKLLHTMPKCTSLIAICVLKWHFVAEKFATQLLEIAILQKSSKLWNALICCKLADWTVFDSLPTHVWQDLAHASPKFWSLVWQDTPVFQTRHTLLLRESICAPKPATSFFLSKQPTSIRLLTRYTLQLFEKMQLEILCLLPQNIGFRWIAKCYEFAAQKGKQTHVDFLKTHWPLMRLDDRWLQIAKAHDNDFFVQFFVSQQSKFLDFQKKKLGLLKTPEELKKNKILCVG